MTKCLPPRAFSISEKDDAYCPIWRVLGPLIDVFLDGVEQTKVLAYNADEGWVRRWRTDERGLVVVNASRTAAVPEVAFGSVEAQWRGSASHGT